MSDGPFFEAYAFTGLRFRRHGILHFSRDLLGILLHTRAIPITPSTLVKVYGATEHYLATGCSSGARNSFYVFGANPHLQHVISCHLLDPKNINEPRPDCPNYGRNKYTSSTHQDGFRFSVQGGCMNPHPVIIAINLRTNQAWGLLSTIYHQCVAHEDEAPPKLGLQLCSKSHRGVEPETRTTRWAWF